MAARAPRRLQSDQGSHEPRCALGMAGRAKHRRGTGQSLPRLRSVPSPAVLISVTVLLLTSGCGFGSTIPNPFAADEPKRAPATPTPPATPTTIPATLAPAVVQPTPAFAPVWVKNHRLAEMWSGPADVPGIVSFGTTSRQFCSFQVVLPPEGQRLYVFNPHSRNYFWIDADAVGPVGPPEQRAGPPPAGQNCAEAVYTG
jgi:hypothetical protein